MDESVLDLAFDLMDIEGTRILPIESFTNMLLKLMKPVESTDFMCMHRNVEALCAKLQVDTVDAPLKTVVPQPEMPSKQVLD